MKFRSSHRFALVILFALASRLEATHPLPGPHYIICHSEGAVVRLEWDHLGFAGGSLEARLERDGSIIAKLESSDLGYVDRGVAAGSHTYRLAIVQGEQTLDSKECTVSVGAGVLPPESLTCSIQEKAPPCVDLQWRNAGSYDAVVVRRDGAQIAALDGEATRFTEAPGPGLHTYEVHGVVLGELSVPATCEADLGGTPIHRLYFFNLPRAGEGPEGPASDQLAVHLENTYPVSAWSFGICSDPAVIVPIAAEVGWTVAALNLGQGPEFMRIEFVSGGLTMRAIINDTDPSALLPAGANLRLLTLRYGGGPQAVPGEIYPLEFCDVLGDPPVPLALVVNGTEIEPATEPGRVLASAWRFLRGDSNTDGAINLSDGVFTRDWLFLGGRWPDCLEAANANGSSRLDLADAIYTFNFLFLGGPEPPAPFPECGTATIAVGCDRSQCP